MKQVIDGVAIYRALSDLARRYQFRNRDEVCCYGLTVSQCYALQFLAGCGKATSSDLAARLGLDLSTTTRLVDQLVRKKLAVRRRSDQDARIREIEITEPARRLISRIEQDLAAELDRALADLPATVKQALPEALNKITSAICQRPLQIIAPGTIRKIST